MTDFASLTRCAEISDEVVSAAVLSHDAMKSLLARAAEIAQPMEGAARVLVALARMATTACTWLEGDLVVEIVGDDEVAVVSVMAELGGGMRERVFPTFALHVSIDEFVRAVRLVPRMVLPLRMQQHAGRLVFSATEAVRHSTRPPPAIEVEEDFLSIEVTAPESAPKLRARPSLERLVVAEAPPVRAATPQVARTPDARPAREEPKLPVAVVEERVDRGSSRRMPVATKLEERPSAKLPIVPREEVDDLGAFFDDLDEAPPPRTPAEPPAAQSPKPPPKPAPPMLMPRFDAAPKPKPKPRPRSKPPSEPAPKPKPARERHSQKPTVARMSAIRPEELQALDALRPARVPSIPEATHAPAAKELTKPTAGRLPAVSLDAPPSTRRVASTRPPAPRSAPPPTRPNAIVGKPPVDDDKLDDGWE